MSTGPRRARWLCSLREFDELRPQLIGDGFGHVALNGKDVGQFAIKRVGPKDAISGPTPIEVLARVAAQLEEPDRAIAALKKLLSIPYESPLAVNVPLTPAVLRLDPMFDRLQNNSRFQKIVESSKPNTADK